MAMGLAGWAARARLAAPGAGSCVEHGVVGQPVRAEGDELSGDRPVDELCADGQPRTAAV